MYATARVSACDALYRDARMGDDVSRWTAFGAVAPVRMRMTTETRQAPEPGGG